MGDISLTNRIGMAALTRQRCDKQTLIPNELLAQYYAQRASAGFIITECSPVSERSAAYPG